MGKRTLPADLIARIRKLLAEPLAPEAIAERLDVNIRVVYEVSGGKVKPSTRKPRAQEPLPGGIVPFDPMAAPVFCEGCQRKVRMPCLACQLKAIPKHAGGGGRNRGSVPAE